MKRRDVLEGVVAATTLGLVGPTLAAELGDGRHGRAGPSAVDECCCGSDCDWEDCCPLCADCGQQELR